MAMIMLAGLMLLAGCGGPSARDLDLRDYFSQQGVVGSFLLYDESQHEYLRYCQDQCKIRYLPASTFKLLNAQIALETGVIADEKEIIPWDGTDWGISSWNQDQNLRTAMEGSVVWFYLELARRIGPERMQSYVDLVGYGNRDLSGPAEDFWLEGKLRISPQEQIDFLKRLYHQELPFSSLTMETVKDIIILNETPTYRLSGKTGWSSAVDPDVGWFVGYVERSGGVYYFATVVNQQDPRQSLGKISQSITMAILESLGIVE